MFACKPQTINCVFPSNKWFFFLQKYIVFSCWNTYFKNEFLRFLQHLGFGTPIVFRTLRPLCWHPPSGSFIQRIKSRSKALVFHDIYFNITLLLTMQWKLQIPESCAALQSKPSVPSNIKWRALFCYLNSKWGLAFCWVTAEVIPGTFPCVSQWKTSSMNWTVCSSLLMYMCSASITFSSMAVGLQLPQGFRPRPECLGLHNCEGMQILIFWNIGKTWQNGRSTFVMAASL